MRSSLRRLTVSIVLMAFVGMEFAPPAAHAGMISTESVLNAQQAQQNRARVRAFMQRDDVRTYLEQQGVAPDDALARVDRLTDNEVATVAGRLDRMPAGGSIGGDLLGVALVVFIVLLITDILGFTDVFPFVVKQHRR